MTTSPTRTAALALYTPPFRYEHGYIFDANGHMVADDCGEQPGVAARVRGGGRIGYMKDAEALQDEVGVIVAEILTAHWGRAPAAPVPQGVVEPIDTVQYWRDAYANPQGDEHFMGHGMVVKIFDDYLGMLAAAPQPPEAGCSVSNGETQAAPVQLPEPVAFVHTPAFAWNGNISPVVSFAKYEDDYKSGIYSLRTPLYTEQQVRELLAAHGIGVPS